ncbi:MAG: sensor histidine kinase, partial [Geminicoccaceae bacterium]|nr:sensor histidine kinase [Geminicoccaceae bacterium]
AQGLLKALTASVSLATAAIVWPVVPRAIAVPGSAELRSLNAELLSSIEAERRAGRALRDAFGEIELRVRERTRDLAAANDRLRAEIEDRERAERHQQMLLAELRHRTRNTLAIVKSIAAQTRQHSDSIDAFSRSFNARVQALADTHTLLFESNWTHSSLDQLIRQHLRPYGGERRAELRGPEVPVRPKAALSLSLVLHELTANAAKYGALSTNHGAIGVEWQREGDAGNERLVIVWREAGGPEVAAPSRRGFGSEVVELTIQLEFNGEAIFDFDPKGLIVNMSLPLTDGEL